jgi:hypothetical protein
VLLAVLSARAAVVELNVANAPGHAVGPSFLGLSYEKNTIYTPLFRSDNSGLIALFQRLGPGILRVGGNSVDLTRWDFAGTGLVKGTVAPADLTRLAGFLRATDWKVIYGVNLSVSTPDTAASEAAAADSILGDRLAGLEIGNEPDLYYKNGDRPATWTFEQFRAEWDSFHVAMAQRAPGVPFTGPATAGTGTWLDDFAHQEANNISLLTFHYYVSNGQLATSTVAKLLQPNPGLGTTLHLYDSIALATGIPGGFRVAETNSYYNGGAPGVSASYGSGLWALEYLFTLASSGGSGLNFHGGGSGPGYTPIADNSSTGAVVQVRPEYYALSLFSLVAHGLVRKAALSDSSVLSGWTVDDSDGSRHIVLLNEDTLQNVSVALHPGSGFDQPISYTLSGTNLDSSTGVTLGGVPIGTDGSWNPSPTAWTLVGDSLVTTVAPATARIFTFRKANSIQPPAKVKLPATVAGPAFDPAGHTLPARDPSDLRIRLHRGLEDLSPAP